MQFHKVIFHRNFNSIKVRLKRESEFNVVKSKPSFQFHKGTIKTRVMLLELFVILTYFNSIKVRLKQTIGCLPKSANSFQFHKGTIKTERADNWVFRSQNFNSIKVRLKRRALERRERFSLRFQFHKGTIKTGVSIDLPQCAQISIP